MLSDAEKLKNFRSSRGLSQSQLAESVGQCLYYSKMTGKKPAVAIILKKPTDYKYIRRIIKANKSITIFKIKAY